MARPMSEPPSPQLPSPQPPPQGNERRGRAAVSPSQIRGPHPGTAFGIAIVIGCFGVADRLINGGRAQFFTAQNARTIAAPTATIVVAALGMTLIIIAGGIDLSAGTALAVCVRPCWHRH